LNYAREYHLDISPTIINVDCDNGGELVPDKKLREFKPTNPKGAKEAADKVAKQTKPNKEAMLLCQSRPLQSTPTGHNRRPHIHTSSGPFASLKTEREAAPAASLSKLVCRTG
jgi:hypothetical protein